MAAVAGPCDFGCVTGLSRALSLVLSRLEPNRFPKNARMVLELGAAAESGTPSHPCDIRFGREVVRVLAAAEAGLESRSLTDAFLAGLQGRFLS